jgi:ribosome biogenesis GTPase A
LLEFWEKIANITGDNWVANRVDLDPTKKTKAWMSTAIALT